MFNNSKWIWAEGNLKLNDRILVRKKLSVQKPPKTAMLTVAASDSYNLYINGKLIVYDGGLLRPAPNGSGYYDEIDIARYLNKGDNVIGFKCAYYGTDGNGHIGAGAAGIIFECADIGLFSDITAEVYRPDNYTADIKSACNAYGGGGLFYDAGKGGDINNVFEVTYGSTLFSAAHQFGEYMTEPFNELVLRPLPLFMFDNAVKARFNRDTENGEIVYTAELGDAMYAAPIIEITAMGSEKITIMSDRYLTSGKWADDTRYTNRRIEYICKNGVQTFESDICLSGTAFKITAPASVKISAVSFRRTYYKSDTVGQFRCTDRRIDTLIEKSVTTLEASMRESLIDSPDRDRGTELFSFSVAARAATYMFDDNALLLIKKTILDTVSFSKLSIKNNAVSPSPKENVISSLMFMSSFGAVAAYYNRTADNELMGEIYSKLADYLLLWEIEGNKLVSRKTDDNYIDSGYNIDAQLIETALYCSAADFLVLVKDSSPLNQSAELLALRSQQLKNGLNSNYLKEEGYTSVAANGKSIYDDRATALIVLAGLYQPEQADSLIKILSNVHNASPLFEPLCLEALIVLGSSEKAFSRMIGRYAFSLECANPTLSEYFNNEGALCYAGSVGIINVLFGGFLGLKPVLGDGYDIKPQIKPLDDVKFSVPACGGLLNGAVRGGKGDVVIDNNTTLKVNLVVGDKKTLLNRGKSKNFN